MLPFPAVVGHCLIVLLSLANRPDEPANEASILAEYKKAGLGGGDPVRGKRVFESNESNCKKCHAVQGETLLAGPDLRVIGDMYGREMLIQSVLEPSAWVHPDHGTVVVSTKGGKSHTGVLRRRTASELQLIDAEGTMVRLPVTEIDQEQRTNTSLMPAGLYKTVKAGEFADLIAYLETLRQPRSATSVSGMPERIPDVETPVRLVPFPSPEMRFDNPVWMVAVPGQKGVFLVVEQKSRKVWRIEVGDGTSKPNKEVFADFSAEAVTGEFEGVVCLAFHPRFRENRKYYVNYHVRNQGSFFSPVIVERLATADLKRDAGVPSRRILQIPQDTDLHWGGMLAFGPDGFLYIGAGDAGPQEDPDGHGQDLSLLIGKILRIDVDRQENGKGYAIPESNPYRNAAPPVRPEIWASGFRMPWRFSFDPVTNDLWVGEVGQNLFEEVSIVRRGENHGWNVHEGFQKFSDRYRRSGETYTPPVFSYRRNYGPSVTGGYVYRGTRNKSYKGVYVFGDFESKRLFALTQSERRLVKVRQIGASPQRVASFAVDSDGELFLIGYEGTIYRIVLDGSDFGKEAAQDQRVKILQDNKPASVRVSITGSDGKPQASASAQVRKTSRGDLYFYVDGAFHWKRPAGEARLDISGGLEMIPQSIRLDDSTPPELTVRLQPWINMASRGWYSGDSHVHLHTGGPIGVTVADALVAAKAEGLNYVNLCVSNNLGDDIRDANLITGKPDPASTDRHLLVFGEEMRSTIYGHMQFFGIKKLVEPQYTGFDNTPNRLDFPANHVMAREAVEQGGVVTYGHPLFKGQPFPFEADLATPSGAARELPVDAVLGLVHAVNLMSYNSDEEQSVELWYRLLNCGFKLAACVGTDALLDQLTDPLGGDRVYVKTDGPFTMQSWLEGLKSGRSLVTNGPIPTLEIAGKGPGETVSIATPGKVRVSATIESYVPFNRVELIVNGKVARGEEVSPGNDRGVRLHRLSVELPMDRSGWVAVRVRGPASPLVFDGPAWAHTSPIYIKVGDQLIESPDDAAFFVGWIEKLLGVVAARNRYPRPEDRREVETIFRKAQDEFRKMAASRR